MTQKPKFEEGHEEYFQNIFDEINMICVVLTQQMNPKRVSNVIRALGQLVLDSVEENPKDEGYNQVSSFGMRKLMEVSLVNLHRFKDVWIQIEGELSSIAKCNSYEYRYMAIEVMEQCILEVYNYNKRKSPSGIGSKSI